MSKRGMVSLWMYDIWIKILTIISDLFMLSTVRIILFSHIILNNSISLTTYCLIDHSLFPWLAAVSSLASFIFL